MNHNTIKYAGFGMLFIGLCSTGWCGKIVYPWRATTAIVKAGEPFEVWFDADENQKVESVELVGPYSKVQARMDPVKGNWVYDNLSSNTYDTLISVMVPAGTPADRYTLLLHTTSGDEKSSGAVKVIKAFRDQYYVMQWSDAHRWQGGHDGMHTMRKISEMLKIANIMDPEIIIETGDNMYNVRNHPEREASYFHGFPEQGILGMHDTPAATFMVAGNHDSPNNSYTKDAGVAETARFYNTFYGLNVYNFSYGNGRFCIFNDAWGMDAVKVPSQGAAAVAWLDTVGRGNFVLSAAHIKDELFKPFDDAVDADLGLVGHNHHIAHENPRMINGKPMLFIAGSIRDKANFEFNLFRVDNLTGAYEPVGGTDGRCQVILNQDAAIIADSNRWIPNLERSFEKENDGSSVVNAVVITNRYSFPIVGAKVRFVMPKGRTYAVSQGVVEQAFDGDSVRVVDVRVFISANSTIAIKIAPSKRSGGL